LLLEIAGIFRRIDADGFGFGHDRRGDQAIDHGEDREKIELARAAADGMKGFEVQRELAAEGAGVEEEDAGIAFAAIWHGIVLAGLEDSDHAVLCVALEVDVGVIAPEGWARGLGLERALVEAHGEVERGRAQRHLIAPDDDRVLRFDRCEAAGDRVGHADGFRLSGDGRAAGEEL